METINVVAPDNISELLDDNDCCHVVCLCDTRYCDTATGPDLVDCSGEVIPGTLYCDGCGRLNCQKCYAEFNTLCPKCNEVR